MGEGEGRRGPADRVLTVDYVMVLLLLVFSVGSRVLFVDHPNALVFDEQHFGKFLSYYITGEYFFDIHPPIGKLVLGYVGYLTGYDGSHGFNHQGEVFPDFVPFHELRLVTTLLGSLITPLMYITARLLGASPTPAALAGWFVLLDNVLHGECRYIVTDAFLFFFDLLCIFASALLVQIPNGTTWYYPAVFLCGLAIGCAVSVKYTAGGIVGTVGVHQMLNCFVILRSRKRRKGLGSWLYESVERAVLILATAAAVFMLCWWLHFHFLPYAGTGNEFHSSRFIATLLEKETGKPASKAKPPMGFVEKFQETNRNMHNANMGIVTKHPFASYWYQWPFATTKALLLWQEVRGKIGMWLWLIGNPVVWIASFALGVVLPLFLSFACLFLVMGNAQRANGPEMVLLATYSKLWLPLVALLIGWLGNVLPFALVPRETWLYHYAPGLLVAISLMSVALEVCMQTLRVISPVGYKGLRVALALLFVLAMILFVYLAPFLYGTPITIAEKDSMFLFDSWSP